MPDTIFDLVVTFYTAFPLLFWIGVLGMLAVLLITLATLSLCRASGQADERTERMAAQSYKPLR
jgi:hypothetical protein